ncbi:MULTISPECIES: spore germination protein [Paenibacillus]|jgi:spore germination protein PA|uniref:Spore germination protein n=1 Tax=Paenibacillus oceani TaxID=2772510 RepID=A0A927H1R9_9BACL|nr:spore germination protein [Paenibacillus oceani]MBD2863734.1 spore germination protein [Paenibacillus oceani]MDF2662428.1 spore germination protein GerPA/GerPF [Paenibacillus sp.]
MPAIVGNIKILSVGNSSIVHIGDSLQLSPTSTSKTFAGAGSFNTGVNIKTFNGVNNTNTLDAAIADSNTISLW